MGSVGVPKKHSVIATTMLPLKHVVAAGRPCWRVSLASSAGYAAHVGAQAPTARKRARDRTSQGCGTT